MRLKPQKLDPESGSLMTAPNGKVKKAPRKPIFEIKHQTPEPGHDTQIQWAQSRTKQAEARTEHAKIRAEQAETRSEQAETRTGHAKTRTEQAEIRAEEAETRSEKAIRDSELNYRRLFEAAKEGILILDADTGRISDVNPFLVEMLGLSHDALVGTLLWEFGPFKDIVANKAKFDHLHQQGYVRSEDLSLETSNGRKLAVEFVSNVYKVGNRNVIQCYVHDMTERKRAEGERLHRVQSRLAAIVDSSDDAIMGKTLAGVITSWNAAAERMFSYTAQEAIGRLVSMIVPPDRLAEEEKILAQLARGERVDHIETIRMTKEGRLLHVSITISPVKEASGQITGTSEIVRDITERKRIEEDVRQLHAILEEKTAQLQANNQELACFSNSVSHDLRTPLRHVMRFVELLQKDAGPSLSEKSRTYISTILRSAKQMGNLIDDLLDFSRNGKIEMHKQEVDLDELIQDTLRDFQGETKDRKVVWKIQPLPKVLADRPLLRMVMVNLVSNALKYTGTRAEAQIEIGGADGNGETVIFIRDNGAGFDPQYTEKLFGVFQRLHSSEEFEGTGIGLANVRRIIHRHGGRTWAEGLVDGGATFFFSLPWRPVEGLHVPLETGAQLDLIPPQSAVIAKETTAKSLNVLMIEDSPEDAFLLAVEIRNAGFEPHWKRVETEAEFRASLAEKWDIICSDSSMPKFSAERALALLKESKLDIPFIVVSGTKSEERAVESLKAGAADYLVKGDLDRAGTVIERALREVGERRFERRAALARDRESRRDG